MTADAIEQAADRLRQAALTRVPCPPVRDLIGAADVERAYAVQKRLTELRLAEGRTIVGRKIGLTSQAVQHQLGVDQPDFGVLFDDMARSEDEPVDMRCLLQPRVEAEIAFVLAADIDDAAASAASVGGSVATAVAALEIVDSRVADWDIRFGDTVADNGSAGLFVLGAARAALADFDPVTAEMTMSVDGERVSTGSGAACLGDPLAALAWLARTSARFGQPLRAGDVVLSGALGPMVPVWPGSTVRAQISGLGTVTAVFAPGALAR